MSRLQKIFALGGVAVLILGAIIIRDRQAGYIAYNNFDYKTAEVEFSKSADRGDPWSSYFVGLIHDRPHFGQIDRKKAAKAFLKSAKLGITDGAIRYLDLVYRSQNSKSYCPIVTNLMANAVATHRFLAIVQYAKYLGEGKCTDKDPISRLHHLKWAGDLEPQFGSNYVDTYESMSATQRSKFDAEKFTKPRRIEEKTFLKIFFAALDQTSPPEFK